MGRAPTCVCGACERCQRRTIVRRNRMRLKAAAAAPSLAFQQLTRAERVAEVARLREEADKPSTDAELRIEKKIMRERVLAAADERKTLAAARRAEKLRRGNKGQLEAGWTPSVDHYEEASDWKNVMGATKPRGGLYRIPRIG